MAHIDMYVDAGAETVPERLQAFAEQWECELEQRDGAYVLLPPFMLRMHGIRFERDDHGWLCEREDDATTWEDYLMVRFAHETAAALSGHLRYGGRERQIVPEPDSFATFDLYVETVLAGSPSIVKETKKMWMYSHRKRSMR